MSERSTDRAVRIGDVARHAGVSVSTVSYALSGKRPISAATRERVEASVAALGYRPHAGARALASRRTGVLALVAPLRNGVEVSVVLQFVAGVVTRARQHDYDVLLTTEDEHGVDRLAAGSMVDAVIVMDVEQQDARLPGLRSLRQPVVLIGVPDDPRGFGCVDLDFEAVGRLAVRHLQQQGCRRVALLGAPTTVRQRHTGFAVRLLRGYRDNLVDQPALDVSVEAGAPEGAAAVHRLLDRDPGVDGVVVHNESALPGVVEGLRAMGRADLPLLAVCPADVARSLPAGCAWVEVPATSIGESAVDMVLRRAGGGVGDELHLVRPRLSGGGHPERLSP